MNVKPNSYFVKNISHILFLLRKAKLIIQTTNAVKGKVLLWFLTIVQYLLKFSDLNL